MPPLNQEQVELLLWEVGKRERIPPAAQRRLTKVYTANKNSTERIFLDYGGLSACIAYLFTQYTVEDVKGKQPKKVERKGLVTILDRLSTKNRQAAAEQLMAALKPVAKDLEKWIRRSRRREIKRDRVKISFGGAGS
ncbi:hypothetical protein F5883DRAFT_529760 [Diaporthe sp. PMI_573]|nr:hypothetical protein F5883DRAFT_529760 [Diaporthaceae sp. PMI_573]